MTGLLNCAQSLLERTTRPFDFLAPLALRIYLAPVFILAGSNKLQHAEFLGPYFESLGIPAPELMVYIAGLTELLGGIGLLIALVWTARSGERHADPNRLMLGYITRLAITEVGALLGILGLFLTGSTAAPYLGLALFLLSLAVLAAGWFIFRLVDVIEHFLKKWTRRTETLLDDQLVPMLRKTGIRFVSG